MADKRYDNKGMPIAGSASLKFNLNDPSRFGAPEKSFGQKANS